MVTINFEQKTKELIDNLKATCATYGLGNDVGEFRIITQVFLYKFLNDKFAYEVKKIDKNLAKVESWEQALCEYSDNDYEMLLMKLGPDTARLKPEHFISYVFTEQNKPDFAKLFDDTLRDIAITNNNIFSVKTDGGAKVTLFDPISTFIIDTSKRDDFCKSIINRLVEFSFEHIFTQKYDFYATIFEYLIKDYNNISGGTYAEYYTPHAVAKIMAAILVANKVQDVTCYDPSAGSGTLLMSLAHAIGEDRCTIYSQDISQKSSNLLRLNLILNNLVHSIQNIIQGNTLLHPWHKEDNTLKKFDYVVSNPPFKMDFSDFRDDLDSKENQERFFAGIPKVPKKAIDKMAIYTLFLQHIMFSLKENGKAAVVVPTGFITAKAGIGKKIRKILVEEKMLGGVVSMPSNIFATTGTNVSIIFIDKSNKDHVVLIDASGLGETTRDNGNQKTVLTEAEENEIITTFNSKETKYCFSAVVSYEDIIAKNYSLSAGHHFDIKIAYTEITHDDFEAKIENCTNNLKNLFSESKTLEHKIIKQLAGLKYDG